MDAAVLPGVFALVGVLLGGSAAHVFSLRREREARRHQLDLENRNLLRARREELYSLVAKWTMLISTNNLTFSSVMQGKLDYNDANDIMIKSGERTSIDFERIDLLIDAFCDVCRPQYEVCLAGRSEINQIFSKFRHQYDQTGPFVQYPQLQQYIVAGTKFEKQAEILKSVIVSEVRGLN